MLATLSSVDIASLGSVHLSSADAADRECCAFSLNDSLGSHSCEQYILSIPRFSNAKHSLTDLRGLLEELGNPHHGKKIIHVAGTNGKGSVCAYLHSIFNASGIKSGLFTSPHLCSLRERIKIQNRLTTEEEFVTAFNTVKNKLENFHPTFFEYLFLMALLIFAKEDVECLILETGLGGRLDATNVLEDKDLTIITPISYDHMEHLGTTLTLIAGEKAGIMRPKVPLVTFNKDPEVITLLREKAMEIAAPLVEINDSAIKINKIATKTIDFSYQYRYDIIIRSILTTKALYQIDNASLAIHSALIFNDERISVESIQRGLNETYWPGRMEELKSGVIIDGAHNENGILAFVASVRAIPCNGRRFLLFSGVREKQSREMITILKEDSIFDEIISCSLDNPRSLTGDDLLDHFLPEQIYPDVENALSYLTKKKKQGDLIFITGSLYLYSEVKLLLTEGTNDQF